MRPGARLSAAIEVLDQVISRHQPVATALADWGKAHRFAGSGDRDAIGRIVYDAVRVRASASYVMGAETPRAIALGSLALHGMALAELSAMCTGSDHSSEPLTADEQSRLEQLDLSDAPAWVKGNFPEWLHGSLERAFGADVVAQTSALAERAPADIRVNSLKATTEKVCKALRDFKLEPMAYAPLGLRIPPPSGSARTPNLQAEAAFQAGWFEIQDQGSQLAAALSGAGPREQILDFCAGGGGKTLALAAAMQNTGQIYAFDADRHRLKPIFERIKRAGVRNAQILRAGDREALSALGDRFDLVFIDAPCTGTGTWRRRPDAKWRLKPAALEKRLQEQRDVLDEAIQYVKPGGRLVYVTCSILPEENVDQVAGLLERHGNFELASWKDVWRQQLDKEVKCSADGNDNTLLLTPGTHGTDGFFVAVVFRKR